MNERVVDFFYILMRDHAPCGVVEDIMQNHVEYSEGNESSEFTNKGLEQYARDITLRLEDIAAE